jgi:succinate dehydrogenase / fumarate reductase, cytochrome b subunit
MQKNRPVNLDLTTMRFPVTAIASILHRASGVLLFIVIPVLLWWLSATLNSEQQFIALTSFFKSAFGKSLVWLVLSALFYHGIMGIKHLFMDIGFFEEKCSAKVATLTGLTAFVAIVVLMGVWLWV